jgi:response regulator RpfG family c-di-GMP phosphodiesterase
MQTFSVKKATVLYIYNFFSVLIVPKYLVHFGCNCITALYKENFIEIAAEQKPDIIILDQFSTSEIGFCRQLKNNEKTTNIRLIVITFDIEIISKAVEAGVDAFLNAPVLRIELLKLNQPEIRS